MLDNPDFIFSVSQSVLSRLYAEARPQMPHLFTGAVEGLSWSVERDPEIQFEAPNRFILSCSEVRIGDDRAVFSVTGLILVDPGSGRIGLRRRSVSVAKEARVAAEHCGVIADSLLASLLIVPPAIQAGHLSSRHVEVIGTSLHIAAWAVDPAAGPRLPIEPPSKAPLSLFISERLARAAITRVVDGLVRQTRFTDLASSDHGAGDRIMISTVTPHLSQLAARSRVKVDVKGVVLGEIPGRPERVPSSFGQSAERELRWQALGGRLAAVAQPGFLPRLEIDGSVPSPLRPTLRRIEERLAAVLDMLDIELAAPPRLCLADDRHEVECAVLDGQLQHSASGIGWTGHGEILPVEPRSAPAPSTPATLAVAGGPCRVAELLYPGAAAGDRLQFGLTIFGLDEIVGEGSLTKLTETEAEGNGRYSIDVKIDGHHVVGSGEFHVRGERRANGSWGGSVSLTGSWSGFYAVDAACSCNDATATFTGWLPIEPRVPFEATVARDSRAPDKRILARVSLKSSGFVFPTVFLERQR